LTDPVFLLRLIAERMSLAEFLDHVFSEGQVSAGTPTDISKEELQAAEQVLVLQERMWRLDMPAGPPAFCSKAALWAARHLYRACQCVVCRDIGEMRVAALLDDRWVDLVTPDVHYSVDLTFRFLPDLLRIAETAASDDPLVQFIRGWCREWPLSSVGVKGLGQVDPGVILDSRSLMQLYVDRIIAREDRDRLTGDPVLTAVQRALGMYPELAPKLREVLFSKQEPHQ
jgi:hypothetical protein